MLDLQSYEKTNKIKKFNAPFDYMFTPNNIGRLRMFPTIIMWKSVHHFLYLASHA